MGEIIPFRLKHKNVIEPPKPKNIKEYAIVVIADENGKEKAVIIDENREIVKDDTKRHLLDILQKTLISEQNRKSFNTNVKHN